MTNRENHGVVTLLAFLLILSACGSAPPQTSSDSAPRNGPANLPSDAVPRAEPKSRYGNGPYYQVYGVTYRVLDSSYGYKERGVASWYGKKFHGRKTSSQEPYDMYAMTAAHKSLPLPSYVRVRNLKNNRSIIVRVNDRGPFVDNRLIDLSYSAALKLDMVQAGTGLVEVTAISFDEAPATQKPAARRPTVADDTRGSNLFVQVGAFGDKENAQRRHAMLKNRGFGQAFVDADNKSSPAIYRVRIGPIANVTQYDSIVDELQQLGITETHLVND